MPQAPLDPAPLVGATLAPSLVALDAWLTAHHPLWSTRPFVTWRPGWWAGEPHLAAWVHEVDDATLTALEADPRANVALPRALATLRDQAAALSAVGPLATGEAVPMARGLKPRKADQVGGFLAATEHALRGGEGTVVEWCAGRGHLGRTLSTRLGRRALLLERNPTLCAPARGALEQPGVAHVCVDVFDDAVHAALPDQAAFVGLHACGRLTDRLLDVALARGAEAIAAAPCCPHRLFGAPNYVPRSAVGRASSLRFNAETLRLSVLDDVVGSPRERARRHREWWLRVAVDLLAREATGGDEHWAFPSVAPVQIDLSLVDFVDWVRRTHQVPVPARWDPDAVGRAAAARLRIIRAGAAVCAVFRRPLELWIVLDRALSLTEAGLDVSVGTFCARTASPRDLLIVGRA